MVVQNKANEMDKSEVMEHHTFLNNLLQDFVRFETLSKRGKKRATKDEAKKNIRDVMDRFKSYVTAKPDLLEFLTTSEESSVHRAFQWDDLINPLQFRSILGKKLEEMESLISGYEA